MSGTITGMAAQRRHPERANLHIDGEFRCGVAYEVVLAEGLRTGSRISQEQLERLIAADERWRAKQAALSLLAARPRARRELAGRLQAKRFGEDAVAWTLAEVERLGLMDDRAFADAFVRDRLRLRPRGARALRAELSRKGVAQDIAAAAVEDAMRAEGVADGALCLAAAEKWVTARGRLGADDDARQLERRLAGFLMRRGYAGEDVRRAVRAVLPRRPG
jgi:regulatory protein